MGPHRLPVFALRWHTVPRDFLTWRELDGELVVHNGRTGSTHLLEPFAGEVFRLLVEADTAMSVTDLEARLRDDEEAQDEWAAAIEAALSEFQRVGLAEPQQP